MYRRSYPKAPRTPRIAWVLFALVFVGACTPVRRATRIPQGSWDAPGHTETGIASWYGREFAGRPTASGEIFRPQDMTAAHRTLPLGSIVRVTNLDNGRSVVLRVNDRGPFVHGRILDCSDAAARALGFHGRGTTRVAIDWPRSIEPAMLHPNRFWVQVGAFSKRSHAEQLHAQVAAHEPAHVHDGDRYVRVRTGPYEGRDAADAARVKLRAAGFDAKVVPFEFTDPTAQ